MKNWNAPELQELNINETVNGFFNVGWEGPFNVVLGDRNGSDNDSTPDTLS